MVKNKQSFNFAVAARGYGKTRLIMELMAFNLYSKLPDSNKKEFEKMWEEFKQKHF